MPIPPPIRRVARNHDGAAGRRAATVDCAGVQCQIASMNLLVNALKLALSDVAKAKGLEKARVLNKVNARGELVVAIIVPPSRPGE